MVSDSSNGYVSKFKLYTGKSLTGPSFNGATYDLVMDMMRGFCIVIITIHHHNSFGIYFNWEHMLLELFDKTVVEYLKH